jgi:hypothetical protein
MRGCKSDPNQYECAPGVLRESAGKLGCKEGFGEGPEQGEDEEAGNSEEWSSGANTALNTNGSAADLRVHGRCRVLMELAEMWRREKCEDRVADFVIYERHKTAGTEISEFQSSCGGRCRGV